MPKRPRPNPLSEGSLGQIYNWFFKPLVDRYADEDESARSYLEKLFDVDNRRIEQWKAHKPFNIPGLYYAAGCVRLQGVGYRRVKRGTLLLSRIDDRSPDTVDVEFFGGQGGKEQVFCLTKLEWEWIKLNLKLETYDPSKPRHRNKVRRRRLRRLVPKSDEQGEGNEGAV